LPSDFAHWHDVAAQFVTTVFTTVEPIAVETGNDISVATVPTSTALADLVNAPPLMLGGDLIARVQPRVVCAADGS